MKYFAILLAFFATTAFTHDHGKGSGHEKGSSHEHSHGMGKKRWKKGQHFQAMDLNGDNKISKDEWMAQFTKIDGNADGFVTKEEMKAHRKAKRKEWRKSKS